MLHIPLLRRGRPYTSLDVQRAPHHRGGEPFVEVSQANVGLIRRDLLDQDAARGSLAALTCDALIGMCARAAESFVHDTLPLGDSEQTPEDYVRQTSATTGLPHALVRRNMQKIRGVLREMRTLLRGLTRNLDLGILDQGAGQSGGHAMSYVPRAACLGVVLPSNSPGVHSLWVPAIALKTGLVLKPGSAEPWAPYRIIQAFIRSGVPAEAFSYYPTDHAGAAEILAGCGRGILFGDTSTTARWRTDPRVEIHGPGYSKVLLGPDAARDWERHLDVMTTSILENSGRSCVNASGIWVTAHGREIAEALAARLVEVRPRPAEDEKAALAPFTDPSVAVRISEAIDQALLEPGATEITAKYRTGGRLVRSDGSTYLLPTIIHCASADHPLANREYLFPFASVVEVRADELPERLGPTLALTALTEDGDLVRCLLGSPLVARLNLGPIPTPQVTWDQPHEGNLFEHLYTRRAFQVA